MPSYLNLLLINKQKGCQCFCSFENPKSLILSMFNCLTIYSLNTQNERTCGHSFFEAESHFHKANDTVNLNNRFCRVNYMQLLIADMQLQKSNWEWLKRGNRQVVRLTSDKIIYHRLIRIIMGLHTLTKWAAKLNCNLEVVMKCIRVKIISSLKFRFKTIQKKMINSELQIYS